MVFFRYCILHTRPLILAAHGVYDWRGDRWARDPLPPLPEGVRPAAILEHAAYCQGWPEVMEAHCRRQSEYAARGIELHLMVNSTAEDRVRGKHGVRGALVSCNIFVDGWTFAIQDRTRDLDAIYIARLIPIKRVPLAHRIDPLMIVGFGEDLHALYPELSHAEYNQEWLSAPDVASHVNRAHAGLCLSPEEGSMRASLQYLLCGVPVVTTPSRGGRDEFFDTENSLTVDADADAIAAAVAHWKRYPPDRNRVRRRALARQDLFRRRYCRYVAALIRAHGGPPVDARDLHRDYFGSPEALEFRFKQPADIPSGTSQPPYGTGVDSRPAPGHP